MSQDYGKATYVCGRHRKNPVLVYTSRKDRSKVYEFMIAARFKIPGLVSWKCVSCSKVKNGYRNLRVELKRKVPLILVDNDVIKEDPENPLNAEHFCNGKEAVDAVLSRAKMEFVHRHGNDEPNTAQMRETIQDFARETISTTPVPLSQKEKRLVQRTLDARCLPLLHGVMKRRRCKQRKEETVNGEFPEDILEEDVASTSASTSADGDDKTTISAAKRAKREPPHLMVRPLPPYYYTRPNPRSPDPNAYYEEVERIEEHPQMLYDEESLIPGDQQDVAYDIELR